MPIAAYFEEQLEQLRVFMEFPHTTLRILRHDPDLRPMMLRMLAGLDRQADNPHVMVLHTTAFHDAEQYFGALLQAVQVEFTRHQSAAVERELDLPEPRPVTRARSASQRFAEHVGAIAERLPATSVGALVSIIAPDEIHDERGFARAIEDLLKGTASRWSKFVVLDRREASHLGNLHRCDPRASLQVFHLSPEEIQRRLSEALNTRAMAPAEQLRFAAMLGGFYFARHEHEKAAALQRTSVEAARRADSPRDVASNLYNLGNTHVAMEEFEQAEACYSEAVDICIVERADHLLALVLTGLGVALQHQGRSAEADESFATARRLFEQQNYRPGIGYVLDTQGQARRAAGDLAGAEQAWLAADAELDGISSKTFQSVRESGQENVRGRLRTLYGESGQNDKLAALSTGSPEVARG